MIYFAFWSTVMALHLAVVIYYARKILKALA